MGTPASERRKHPRFVTEIRLRGSSDDAPDEVQMVTENLSMGGLYCRSNVDFPEMTRLAVSLELPVDGHDGNAHHELIDLEAVVVRREETEVKNGEPSYRLALFFTYLDEQADEVLSRYLNSLDPGARE